MSNETKTHAIDNHAIAADDLYDEAVGDGTAEPASPKPHDGSLVVESNASNYGASAVTRSHLPEREEEERR